MTAKAARFRYLMSINLGQANSHASAHWRTLRRLEPTFGHWCPNSDTALETPATATAVAANHTSRLKSASMSSSLSPKSAVSRSRSP